MKNFPLRILYLCAAFSWSAAVWQLWLAWNTKSPPISNGVIEKQIIISSDTCRRDPFRRMWIVQIPQTRITSSHQVGAKSVISTHVDSTPVPPLPHWNAFIDGNPPVVVLAKGNKTELVKVGDSVFGWRLLSLTFAGAQLRANSHLAYVKP